MKNALSSIVLTASLLGACAGGEDPAEAAAAAADEPPHAESVAAAETARSAVEVMTVCEAGPEQLAADATLEGGAGSYRLEMIELVDGADGRRAEGTLTLFDMPDELSMLSGTATPLGGATDMDVRQVGANAAGDVSPTDPAGPGVLVLERDDASGRSIILRFGASANRRDTSPFDGAYTVLVVHETSGGDFAGSWRSAAQGPQTTGYFCAWHSDG